MTRPAQPEPETTESVPVEAADLASAVDQAQAKDVAVETTEAETTDALTSVVAESEAAQQAASTLNDLLAPLPEWARLVAILLLVIIAVTIAHRIVFVVLARITKEAGKAPTRPLVEHTRGAAFALFAVVGVSTALALGQTLGLTGQWFGQGLASALAAMVALALTWLVIGLVRGADICFTARQQSKSGSKRAHTQIAVISRMLSVVIAIFGIGVALMQFEQVERIGTSLLASAGIAGIAIGFAAKPVLGNIIAGIQIALTQPISLDDAVVIEGEWGWIEEITTTYVVVRIWDQRRMIVPFSTIIEEPFENWTRSTKELLGSVFIHADYTVPVEAVRTELRRLCEANDKWNGNVCSVQVTEADDSSVQLRALVSADGSGKTWDLRCEIREQLIDYLQREHPDSLPRARELEVVPEQPRRNA
ncbi:MAG: mechanosensitive ion channel family protein [Planctomycetota bacterium]